MERAGSHRKGRSGEGCLPRRLLAGERAREARSHLVSCRLCAHECGVDRTERAAGVCRTDAMARVFQERVDWGGEERLAPTLVVNLSGCNMACSFCITGSRSQNGKAGSPLDADDFGRRLEEGAAGLRSVTIEGGEPTIHLSAALEIVAQVPAGLPVVWKTNAYASDEALELLDGTVDYVLADYKFGNDDCARHLARVPRYTEVVRRNLHWARGRSRLIVRHLLMPGHYQCCFLPVVRWMADEMPDVPLSLMTGFLPVFRSGRHPELMGLGSREEAERAGAEARRLGLTLEPWVLETGSRSGVEWRPTGWKPADGDRAAGGPAPGPSGTPAGAPPGEGDDIWIDRSGRICVGFSSDALAGVLSRLAGELGTGDFLSSGGEVSVAPILTPTVEQPNR